MRTDLTLKDLPPMNEEEKNWWNEHNSEYCHYFYRIDNTVNGKFYYGIHSERLDSGKSPEEDGYMGSGTDLKKAQDEEGIENFKKTVIKTFSTRDEARLEEMIVVDDDLVNDPMCYNLALGGGCSGNTKGLLPVDYRDEKLRKGKFFLIPCEEYWKEPEKYIIQASGHVPVIEKSSLGDGFKVIPKEEYWKNKNQYLATGSGFVIAKKSGESWKRVTTEEYHKHREDYTISSSNRTPYKNKDDWDDIKFLRSDDPLVLSGQFIGYQAGVSRSKEFINSISGEKNGSYGTTWITNGKENKKADKGSNIPEGWWKGRTTDSYRLYINIRSGEKKYFISGEEESEFFPSTFFRGGKIISFEDLNRKYVELGTWEDTCKFYHMTKRSMKELRSYFESLGYKFDKNK